MKTVAFAFIMAGIFLGCSRDSDMEKYRSIVKTELAASKRVDSIFFGIYFGMVRKNFFRHCWEMNKKGIFSDGTGNMYVMYKLDKELKHPASLNFYPDFTDSLISKMRVNIQYNGWAPWNKSLNADSLLPDVLEMYKKWYSEGNSFIEITDKKRGTVYVKVDGNRRITIRKYDDVLVKVDYTDLLVERQIKK